MDSSITLVGNLTRDPQRRDTPTGTPLVSFGIAVNRRWRGSDEEWAEQTSFFDVVAWRGVAENALQSLRKGDRVVVVGRPEQRSWSTSAGDRRSSVEIVADEIAPSLRWATAAVQRRASEHRAFDDADAAPARAERELVGQPF
ncbi:MAG: single-stranded DNA-binding protein [Acidimicrobiia bacterium]|nr:single-stranded DNA-binding protein [Acidimicrobiia bacterium]